MDDLSPSLHLGDEGINMVLNSLQSIRERALSTCDPLPCTLSRDIDGNRISACRACVFAMHAEVSRLLEVQHAFRQLSYFDLRRRLRLTLELTRIAVSLPLALEQAIARDKQENPRSKSNAAGAMLNGRVRAILHGSVLVLARLERFLE